MSLWEEQRRGWQRGLVLICTCGLYAVKRDCSEDEVKKAYRKVGGSRSRSFQRIEVDPLRARSPDHSLHYNYIRTKSKSTKRDAASDIVA